MTQDNKNIVLTAWRAYAAGDSKTAFAAMAEDVRFIMKGKMPGMENPLCGHAPLQAMLDAAPKKFPSGITQEIKSVIGDGDMVVLEYRVHGPVANGRYYDNDYCLVFEMKDGKIQEIREFTDTARILDTIYG